MPAPLDPPRERAHAAAEPPLRAVRLFRWYASLTFAFAWVPVMYTAFTVDRGFTPSEYLELWAVYYASMVLFELPWGWAADRLGQRPLLVAGPLLLACAFVVLGHATSLGTCELAMIAVGSGHAMISGADSAYLYEVLARADRRHTALHEEAVAHRWRLLGVSALDVVGGLVAFGLGTAAAFDLSVLVMLAATVLACRLPALPPARAQALPPPEPLTSRLATALRPGVPWVLFWYAAVFVLLRIGFQLYQPTLLAMGQDDLRLHGATLGFLNLVAGLSALLVLALHARLGERATATAVLALLALSFAGLAALGPVLVPLLFCLQQVSFAFLQPIGRTALNHRIPAAHRAALLSVQSLLARLLFAAVLWAGRWDDALSLRLERTYVGLALVAAGCAAFTFLWHPGRLALESARRDWSSGPPC